VSQLHARAIRRLRAALGEMNPQQVAEMRKAFVEFAAKKPVMAKADIKEAAAAGIVLTYKPGKKVAARATLKSGRQSQAVAAAR
jgi:DNA gyrase/topoisomerase IV subunit B